MKTSPMLQPFATDASTSPMVSGANPLDEPSGNLNGCVMTIDDSSTPDLIVVKIAKPDGCSLRRNVPRECWSESSYRQGLIANMVAMLA